MKNINSSKSAAPQYSPMENSVDRMYCRFYGLFYFTIEVGEKKEEISGER